MKPPLTPWERLWILGAIFTAVFFVGVLLATFGGGGGGGISGSVTVESG